MEQLRFNIEEKIDLWGFENFDWLKGNSENLKIIFTKAIPRLEKMINENPQIERYKKLKADCIKRLKLINENNINFNKSIKER